MCVFSQKNHSQSGQKNPIDERRYPLDEMQKWKDFDEKK